MMFKVNSSADLTAAPTLCWFARRFMLDDGSCLRRKSVAGENGCILTWFRVKDGEEWCLGRPDELTGG